MTLRELKEAVDYAVEQLRGDEDLDVRIPTKEPSIGAISTTGVIGAHTGFDWESGMFIIYPSVKMIEKK